MLGLSGRRSIVLPSGGECFHIHSFAHLVSGLMMDRDVFREHTILAMALDHGPDFVGKCEIPRKRARNPDDSRLSLPYNNNNRCRNWRRKTLTCSAASTQTR